MSVVPNVILMFGGLAVTHDWHSSVHRGPMLQQMVHANEALVSWPTARTSTRWFLYTLALWLPAWPKT
jgi:hypothetical protein